MHINEQLFRNEWELKIINSGRAGLLNGQLVDMEKYPDSEAFTDKAVLLIKKDLEEERILLLSNKNQNKDY